jgi:transcription initiation factor TFIIA large subunit
MSNNTVGSVYLQIINDVIDSSRVDFEEGGVEEAVLEELKQVSLFSTIPPLLYSACSLLRLLLQSPIFHLLAHPYILVWHLICLISLPCFAMSCCFGHATVLLPRGQATLRGWRAVA